MMTLEEEGAYIRLLGHCWLHGSIPSDPEQCARLIGKGGSTTLSTKVLAMFNQPAGEGKVTHDRLEREREKQAVWREKSAQGGKKSAEMRKTANGGSTTLQPPLVPMGQPNGNSSVFCLQTSVNSCEDAPPGKKRQKKLPESEPPSPPDPRHTEFVTTYAAAWKERNPSSYDVQGKDVKALQDFLKKRQSLTVEEMMEYVLWCWDVYKRDGQHAAGVVKASTSIFGFVSSYGQIEAFSENYKTANRR